MISDATNKNNSSSNKWAAIKLIAGAVFILIFVGYTTLVALPRLSSGVDDIKTNVASYKKMLAIAADQDDSAEKAAFVAFTTKAVEDDYMDANERKKSMQLYMAMLKTIEPTECMHPILKKTVGSWMREDWLNAIQKRIDDKPCHIK